MNEVRSIIYLDPAYASERELQEPERLLRDEELARLLVESEEPFRWAFGLIGGKDLNKNDFLSSLEAQARRLDPSFHTL